MRELWALMVVFAANGCGGKVVVDGQLGEGGGATDTNTATTTGEEAAVNGCARGDFVATNSITFSGTSYAPPCVRIAVGQPVIWTGDFATHPLVGGPVVDGTASSDPDNPIGVGDSGTTHTVTFSVAGTYPFFCNVHHAAGMMGAVRVE